MNDSHDSRLRVSPGQAHSARWLEEVDLLRLCRERMARRPVPRPGGLPIGRPRRGALRHLRKVGGLVKPDLYITRLDTAQWKRQARRAYALWMVVFVLGAIGLWQLVGLVRR